MQAKPTILFVDDDPNVLQGLRRMLHAQERAWDLEFATGGEVALGVLRTRSVDVVVTDMRMPGMDGAELLMRIRAEWPGVTRIVLSGHSDQETVIRSVDAAHQYLMKPCDPNTLKRTIARALRLRDLIANVEVMTLLTKLNHVPSLPALYIELREALARRNTSVREVGAIVGKDIAFSAKLLQLVNSAFFGLPRTITTASDAAVLLGTDLIRALVLGTQVFAAMEAGPGCDATGAVWRHSLRTGVLAREIATRMGLGRADVDGAFLAGFVHDIGRLVLEVNLPGDTARCRAMVRDGGMSEEQAEQSVFGATHEALSASLLGIWGLPDIAIEAVAFLHSPRDAPVQQRGSLTAAHVAEVLDRQMHADAGAPVALDREYLERLGLTAETEYWRGTVCAKPEEAARRP